MEKRKRVAVYGNSLNMAGIVASLKADPTLQVECVNRDSPTARRSLNQNDLAAIVFDLSDPPLRLDITILCDRPDLLLIGVDTSRDGMLILSSQPAQALSMADLVSAIHQNRFPSSLFRTQNHIKNNRDLRRLPPRKG